MFSARTIIGIAAGSAIIAISAASMVMDMTQGPLEVSETYDAGQGTTYSITGDGGASHSMSVTAERFQMELASPGGGFSIPSTEFAGSHHVEWTHQESGRTLISLQNTGAGQMVVEATLTTSTDPILFAYRLVVITTGIIIIGFSLGFSLKKPRGF